MAEVVYSIDCSKAPKGDSLGLFNVNAGNRSFNVGVKAWNPANQEQDSIKGFIGPNGYISIEAVDYSKPMNCYGINWMVVPDIWRTGEGIMPDTYLVEDQQPGSGPCIESPFCLSKPEEIKVYACFSPILNYRGDEGLKYAMSTDGEAPQVVNIHVDESLQTWKLSVANNVSIHQTVYTITALENYILKFHMVSPWLVLHKIIIETGVKESGPWP